jgi:hypothetical protein
MKYLNIPHFLFDVWRENPVLQTACPATEDEDTNRFFAYGVDHIPGEQFDRMGAYVVLNDLSSSLGVRQFGSWTFRLRIYSDSASSCQKLLSTYIEAIGRSIDAGVKTDVASACSRWSYSARSLSQGTRNYYTQANLNFIVKG